jgi:hypothetical protein
VFWLVNKKQKSSHIFLLRLLFCPGHEISFKLVSVQYTRFKLVSMASDQKSDMSHNNYYVYLFSISKGTNIGVNSFQGKNDLNLVYCTDTSLNLVYCTDTSLNLVYCTDTSLNLVYCTDTSLNLVYCTDTSLNLVYCTDTSLNLVYCTDVQYTRFKLVSVQYTRFKLVSTIYQVQASVCTIYQVQASVHECSDWSTRNRSQVIYFCCGYCFVQDTKFQIPHIFFWKTGRSTK